MGIITRRYLHWSANTKTPVLRTTTPSRGIINALSCELAA